MLVLFRSPPKTHGDLWGFMGVMRWRVRGRRRLPRCRFVHSRLQQRSARAEHPADRDEDPISQIPSGSKYVTAGPIGSASLRDRVCQYVAVSVVRVAIKKKKKYTRTN